MDEDEDEDYGTVRRVMKPGHILPAGDLDGVLGLHEMAKVVVA